MKKNKDKNKGKANSGIKLSEPKNPFRNPMTIMTFQEFKYLRKAQEEVIAISKAKAKAKKIFKAKEKAEERANARVENIISNIENNFSSDNWQKEFDKELDKMKAEIIATSKTKGLDLSEEIVKATIKDIVKNPIYNFYKDFSKNKALSKALSKAEDNSGIVLPMIKNAYVENDEPDLVDDEPDYTSARAKYIRKIEAEVVAISKVKALSKAENKYKVQAEKIAKTVLFKVGNIFALDKEEREKIKKRVYENALKQLYQEELNKNKRIQENLDK